MTLDLTDWQKKKYTITEGNQVIILCIDAPGAYPIVGYIVLNGQAVIYTWRKDGGFGLSNGHPYDLINAKTKREGWMNIYRFDDSEVIGSLYGSEVKALEKRDKVNYIATSKVEWEE